MATSRVGALWGGPPKDRSLSSCRATACLSPATGMAQLQGGEATSLLGKVLAALKSSPLLDCNIVHLVLSILFLMFTFPPNLIYKNYKIRPLTKTCAKPLSYIGIGYITITIT